MTDFPYIYLWHVGDSLPKDWQKQIIDCARECCFPHILNHAYATACERHKLKKQTAMHVAMGDVIEQRLGWLAEFYRGQGLEHINTHYFKIFKKVERLFCLPDLRHGISLIRIHKYDKQSSRPIAHECHTDWAPTGVLYVTSHGKGYGGELMIARDPKARGARSVRKNSIEIYPEAGTFISSDLRGFPHFVNPMKYEGDTRVTVQMLYCTDDKGSCPAARQPQGMVPVMARAPGF